MIKGLYTAYTAMVNEQKRMDITTNNLANANTVGFKKEGSTQQSFSDVLGLKIKDLSDAPNLPRKLGTMNLGVKLGETYTDWTEGPMRSTGEAYDMAIGGRGLFAVEYTNKAPNVTWEEKPQTKTLYTREAGRCAGDAGWRLCTRPERQAYHGRSGRKGFHQYAGADLAERKGGCAGRLV